MTRTYSAEGWNQILELELVRDKICGLYGQDGNIIYKLEERDRERLRYYLDDILEMLDQWQDKAGLGWSQ